MKTYTFTINRNTNNNNLFSNSSYYSNKLKETIATNIANKYPWLGNTTPKTYVSYTTPYYNNFDYTNAIHILDTYAAKKYNVRYLSFSDMIDEYDFEIDGIPVRIFDDMIQVGNHMFPKYASSSYYASLTPVAKKLFVDIVIKINR